MNSRQQKSRDLLAIDREARAAGPDPHAAPAEGPPEGPGAAVVVPVPGESAASLRARVEALRCALPAPEPVLDRSEG